MNCGRRASVAWPLFLICLIGACVAFGYFIAYPVYKQPDSRLWNSWLGYPAVLRHFHRPIPVSVVTAERRRMTETISGVGAMAYLNSVPVDTDNVGIVVNVQVLPGDHVEPGDTLLTLSTGGQEARQAQLDLELKTEMYEKAKADYDRNSAALKTGLVSQATFEGSKEAYLEAETNMKKSRDTFETTLPSRSQKGFDKGSAFLSSGVGR